MTVKTDTDLAPKQPSGIRTAAVLMIQVVAMGFVIVTPAISVFTEYFGDLAITSVLPVTLISTLPTLFTVIGIFVAAAIMNKLTPKVLAIIASFLFTLGGLMPMVAYTYPVVLVSRAICGFGLGLMNPIAGAIILGCYTGNKQASLLGYGTFFMNCGGIIMQTIGGVLAGVDTTGQLVFITHLFGIIAIVFAFLLPNPDLSGNATPDASAASADAADSGKKEKVKIPGSVWIIAAALFLFQMFNYPAMLNCGTIMMDTAHMGAAALDLTTVGTMSAMALNCFTIFGMVAGVVFGQIFKRLGKWTIPLGWVLCAIGVGCVICVPNVYVICIGMALLGLGYDWAFPAFLSWIGIVSTPKSYAVCISCINVGIQLGSFVSTYWLLLLSNTVGDSVYFPGYMEIIYCIVIAVIFLVYNPFKKNSKIKPAAAA